MLLGSTDRILAPKRQIFYFTDKGMIDAKVIDSWMDDDGRMWALMEEIK